LPASALLSSEGGDFLSEGGIAISDGLHEAGLLDEALGRSLLSFDRLVGVTGGLFFYFEHVEVAFDQLGLGVVIGYAWGGGSGALSWLCACLCW